MAISLDPLAPGSLTRAAPEDVRRYALELADMVIAASEATGWPTGRAWELKKALLPPPTPEYKSPCE